MDEKTKPVTMEAIEYIKLLNHVTLWKTLAITAVLVVVVYTVVLYFFNREINRNDMLLKYYADSAECTVNLSRIELLKQKNIESNNNEYTY